jgi:hypothetical protein
MTTDDDAWAAVGLLASTIPGFDEDTITTFVTQFLANTEDGAVLREVCGTFAATWTGKGRPKSTDVLARYNEHPTVRTEREARIAAAMMSEDGGRVVPYSEGRAILAAEYKAVYGRELGMEPVADPVFAETLIRNEDHQDRDGNWLAHYKDIVRGFRFDQARCQASLKALGRRLIWANNGRLLLKPPPDLPQTTPEPRLAPQAALPAPTPSDDPVDAGSLMRDALGVTRERITD